MTPAEEDYVHFVECIASLNNAWRILKELDSAAPRVVRAAAYRMALVEYAKPYKVSYGTHRRGSQGYLLPVPDLPSADLTLHNKVLDLRDQVLAHPDLTLKDATVYARRVQGKPCVTIGSNLLPSFPSRSAVIALIQRTLDLMYPELARRNEAIAPNA